MQRRLENWTQLFLWPALEAMQERNHVSSHIFSLPTCTFVFLLLCLSVINKPALFVIFSPFFLLVKSVTTFCFIRQDMRELALIHFFFSFPCIQALSASMNSATNAAQTTGGSWKRTIARTNPTADSIPASSGIRMMIRIFTRMEVLFSVFELSFKGSAVYCRCLTDI